MPQAENTYSTRSKAILLLADTHFCLQQHVESASPKKAFCATSSFSLLLKANLFSAVAQKVFCFFSVHFAKMICAVGKKEYLRFSALRRFQIEANTHGRNENVDNLFAFPTKAFVEKTTKH